MNTSIDGFYPRVAFGFAKKTDSDLITFVTNVLAEMRGNSSYNNPMPSLDTIASSLASFQTAVQEALNGGKLEIATRNAARVTLLAQMRQLGSWVQAACGADLATLLSSGFDPVRAPSPVGVLPPPQNPRLTLTGKSGELMLKFDRVNNAVNYSIQTAAAATGPWEDEDLSTTTRPIIGGLTPGQMVWARVCANGSAGASEWTAPTSAMAV